MASERRKTMVGRVVSTKMTKTAVVQVTERRKHPLYGKTINLARRFKAHNEEPLAKLGDLVKIVESRPLSRQKRWQISEILVHGDVVEAIREKELESLIEKEKGEREARKQEEARRAAARLAELAGPDSEAKEEAEAGEAEGDEPEEEDEE